ncbi:hypothetical protein [Rhodopila sp.]|uniref:hypothetical protein n=1 Tax=Rhodopila sp. TaxID=2480087 RepID=UPI003D0B9FCB
MNRVVFFTASTLLLIAVPALAQNPQTAAPENPTVPMAPQNAPSPPPERVAPPVGNQGAGKPGSGSGSLSSQLSRQKGTVRPPNVDPGMTVSPSPRQQGTMPVIPPPGSPGGNPSVVPK